MNTLAHNATSENPTSLSMFGIIVYNDACRKNKSLKDSKPQLIGENQLIVCKSSGIT
jgi:hypothetical protein